MANHGTTQQPQADRPAGITCPKYESDGSKRCRHYIVGGGCALPDEAQCTEWLKRNRPAEPPAPAPARDLFGNPLPEAPAPAARPAPAPQAQPRPEIEPATAKQLRGFTSEDIKAFKALGVELCFESERYGEIWLVPTLTGAARREITPENLGTLIGVALVFPGSRLVRIEKHEMPARTNSKGKAPKESAA